MTSKKFIIHARNFFLTFPEKIEKVSLDSKEMVLDLIKKLFNQVKANPNKIVVAFEESDDDHAYRHYHIYLELDRKFQIRDPRFFDLNGVHGQYESCRSKKASERYVKKDGDFIEFSVSFLPDKPSTSQLVNHIYQYILKHKGLYYEAMRDCIKQLSQTQIVEYSLYRTTIDKTIDDLMMLSHPDKIMKFLSGFKPVNEVEQWLNKDKNELTLLFIGPSCSGKTEYIKSLFDNPLIVSRIDQIKELNTTHDALILDDISLKLLTPEEVIQLVDLGNRRTVNVKHAFAVLRKGLPRIITHTKKDILPTDPSGSIDRRIKLVEITDKLYEDNEK
jgi:hypothetical protein